MAPLKKLLLLALTGASLATNAFCQDAEQFLKEAVGKQNQGDMDGALAAVNKAVALKPGDAEAYELRAQVEEGNNMPGEALQDRSKVVELSPDSAQAYYERGLLRRERLVSQEGVLDDFTKAIALKPDFAEAYDARGVAQIGTEEFQKALFNPDHALADFTAAIKIKPGLAIAWLHRGMVKVQEKDLDGAIGDFTGAIKRDRNFTEAYAWRGLAKTKAGDTVGAEADFVQAMALRLDFGSDWNISKPLRQARDELLGEIGGSMLVKPKPGQIQAGNVVVGLMGFGMEQSSLDTADARQMSWPPDGYFSTAIAADLHNAGAWFGRAHLDCGGNYKGPLSDLDRALELDPQFAVAYGYRGYLKQLSGDAKGAAADFDKAIALDPDFAITYNNRGCLKYNGGDTAGALADFNKAIALMPEFAIAYNNRAHARMAAGDWDGCLNDLHIALKYDYHGLAMAHGYRAILQFQRATDDWKHIELDLTWAAGRNYHDTIAWGYLATLREILGKRDLAKDEFKKEVELPMRYPVGPYAAILSRYDWVVKQADNKPPDPVELLGKLNMPAVVVAARIDRSGVRQEDGDLAGALADYSAALDADRAGKPDALRESGVAKQAKGDAKGALADFAKAVEAGLASPGKNLAPEDVATGWRLIGLVKQADGDQPGALVDFEKASALKPTDASAYALRATMEYEKGDADSALKDLDKAISLDHKLPESFALRGKIELAKGDAPGAKADFKSVGGLVTREDWDAPKTPEMKKLIADVNRGGAQVQEAQGEFEPAMWSFISATREAPGDARNYYDAARMSYRTGDQTHTLGYATKAIELKPDYAEAYALRGSAKLREVRLYNALYIEGRGGFRMWEGFVGGKELPVTPHVDLDGALDDLTQAVTLQPGFAEAYDCRGLVKYFKGDKAGAMDDFSKAIAAKADYAPAWSNRGHVKLETGDAKGALADLDKAIALQPGFAVAWGNRAMVKQAGADLDGAMADIERAIGLNADYLGAYRFRGILRLVKGDAAGAGADIKKAGELEERGAVSMSNWAIGYDDPEIVKHAFGDMDGALAGLEEPPAMPAGDEKLKAAFATAYFTRAGKISYGLGTGDNRMADLDRALALKPDYAEAYRARGLARQTRFYPPDEREELGDFDTNPMRDMPRHPAGDAADSYKQAEKKAGDLALADLAKADELNKGGDAETYRAQAVLKQENGDNAGALEDINKAMKLSPDNSQFYGERADIEKSLGDDKGSRADTVRSLDLAISNAKTPSDTAYAYFCRANDRKAQGDTKGALDDFTKSIEAWPQYSTGYTARAWLNYEDGKMETVMDDLNKSIAIESGNASNSGAFYLRAMIERDKGDIEDALKDFSKSESLGSNDRDVWRDIALIDAGRKDYQSAYDHFNRALQRWLQLVQMHYDDAYKAQFGAWLDGMQADIDTISTFKGTKVEYLLNGFAGGYTGWPRKGAAEKYTPLIALRPGMGALYFIRGHIYFNQHALPAALADFRKAVELGNMPGPAQDDARLFIWVVHAQSGDEKGATEELQAWLDGGKDGPRDGWHAQIARFLTGKVAEPDFINSAPAAEKASAGIETGAELNCDAYFYAGEKRLAAGDKATAADYFTKAMQDRQDGHTESGAAWAELQLLKPEQP